MFLYLVLVYQSSNMPPKKSAAALEKKQDEKRIKEIRAFQRSAPENRRCFDCNEMVRL